MSVTHDCLEGDRIYVIEGFVAQFVEDQAGNIDIDNSICLEIGDSVIYQDWFIKEIGGVMYAMVKYKTENDLVLAAKETFFVTEEVWGGLERYFKSNL